MSHRAKNILIGFLLLVIFILLWMLVAQSYGRYCKPIVREAEPPTPSNVMDSLPLSPGPTGK